MSIKFNQISQKKSDKKFIILIELAKGMGTAERGVKSTCDMPETHVIQIKFKLKN